MPEPIAISAEARAAAADGPMPLTDAAAHAAAAAAVKPDGLPQRHPAAGRRFDDIAPEDLIASLRRQVVALQTALADEQRKRADANKRVADFEAWALTPDDGTCPGCAGHRRTIADLEAARAEDRRLLAAVTLGRNGA